MLQKKQKKDRTTFTYISISTIVASSDAGHRRCMPTRAIAWLEITYAKDNASEIAHIPALTISVR